MYYKGLWSFVRRDATKEDYLWIGFCLGFLGHQVGSTKLKFYVFSLGSFLS